MWGRKRKGIGGGCGKSIKIALNKKTMELINYDKPNLPVALDDLAKFVLVGREKLTMVRAGIRAMDKLDMAEGVRKQKKEEAQMLAEALLDAEVRIGEILAGMPKAKPGPEKISNTGVTYPKDTKEAAAKELGFDKMQVSRFQTLASNPDLVEQVKEEARKSEDLPTRSAVLDYAKAKQKKEKKEKEREMLRELGEKKEVEIDFRLGDFEEVFADIPDASIDCIITDPPYPKEFINCWTKLARFAKRVLKPNGYCITYSGQMYLPEVMQRMCEHLDYYWTFAVYHEGQTQIVNGINLMCRWKPVLIFQNGKKKIDHTFQDYFISEKREKSGHDWQQSQTGVAYLIENFTKPDDLILEPFAGSGTTILVAREKKRRIIAAEINEETYNIAKSFL
jgi:16S rRNA G966 N2-methylase RsmD